MCEVRRLRPEREHKLTSQGSRRNAASSLVITRRDGRVCAEVVSGGDGVHEEGEQRMVIFTRACVCVHVSGCALINNNAVNARVVSKSPPKGP